MNILELIGRNKELFTNDIHNHEKELSQIVASSSFLVIGGAGSIGQAVSKEIFKRNPKKLHVVDISENNMVELVRDIRSSFGYINGDFQTFALDIGSIEYDAFWNNDGKYDYVLNLSALKHVRSEKDPFTMMRMIDVNIFNTEKTICQSIEKGVKKYFCVSTDKAANPANMMGASKRIMEMFLHKYSSQIPISTARFANVAFSDGSLLHGWRQRLIKEQPIAAPNDVRRYFVTPQESGELCLMSTMLGNSGDIFFPKLNEELNMITFSEIAVRFLKANGYKPYECSSEEEARSLVAELKPKGQWPCYFSASDTTGEKEYEEFYVDEEEIDLDRFESLGVVKNSAMAHAGQLDYFLYKIDLMKAAKQWLRSDLIELFKEILPGFDHYEKGKFLDDKM
ncbi:MAG TPA: UDP-N-acetylglucosamine 4,6-dehydratase [Bacteroidales bacterium]|nr:UDP-N-acetylglucosamine 4,6-dehydratase [Bacteroidales bacterium]